MVRIRVGALTGTVPSYGPDRESYQRALAPSERWDLCGGKFPNLPRPEQVGKLVPTGQEKGRQPDEAAGPSVKTWRTHKGCRCLLIALLLGHLPAGVEGRRGIPEPTARH